MALISHNDLAPSEAVHYSLAGAEFDLEGDGTFETNSPEVVANARTHPWLKVEIEQVELEGGRYGAEHLSPEDDVMSAVNSIANDPDAVRAALSERTEVELNRTALDAQLDQDTPEFEGPVAETLAADQQRSEEVESEAKPSRRSRSKSDTDNAGDAE